MNHPLNHPFKIGVFDSGIGGITILSELRKELSFVDYVYLGDTAHLPYGTKSPAQIEKLSKNCARVLREKHVDALVIACNTASSLAFKAIQDEMGNIPVFGVVEPGVSAALTAFANLPSRSNSNAILVLATRATIQSHAYRKELECALKISVPEGATMPPIIEQSCPLLVPMIEEGWIDHSILHQTIAEYVEVHRRTYPSGVALLGCTHYPWISSAFEKALPGWTIVNPAHAVAAFVKKSKIILEQNKIQSQVEWIFTDSVAVPKFAKVLMRD